MCHTVRTLRTVILIVILIVIIVVIKAEKGSVESTSLLRSKLRLTAVSHRAAKAPRKGAPFDRIPEKKLKLEVTCPPLRSGAGRGAGVHHVKAHDDAFAMEARLVNCAVHGSRPVRKAQARAKQMIDPIT